MPTNVASRRDESTEPLSGEHIGQLMPEVEPIILTARDWEAFLALDEVDRPRPRLNAAVQRYRDRQLP